MISANRAKRLHNHQLIGHRVVLILSEFQHGKQETYWKYLVALLGYLGIPFEYHAIVS